MSTTILENELFESFANASDNIYIYVCDMKTDGVSQQVGW